MSESNNIFKEIDVDFKEIKTLKPKITNSIVANEDDEDDLILVSKFGSFDDQHDLKLKIKKPIKTALRNKRRTELVQKNIYGYYPFTDTFLKAAYSNDVNALKEILNNGIDPNYSDAKGRTALHLTSVKGNIEAAEFLLLNGSNVNSKDLNGNSPLHLSVLSNHIRMVTLLLRSGANLKEEDNAGRTPLHLAKSKLKIISDCTSYNSDQLKEEVKHIIEMMQIYLAKTGRQEKLIVLNQFITRFNLHNTKEDVNNDLCDLLQSINNLNIN